MLSWEEIHASSRTKSCKKIPTLGSLTQGTGETLEKIRSALTGEVKFETCVYACKVDRKGREAVSDKGGPPNANDLTQSKG